MSISEPPPERILCNTTPTRIFALVDQFDLLVEISGGEVCVPRSVFDPDEDPDGIGDLHSEIARAERHWASRSIDPQAMDCWFRLRALRQRTDIATIDLNLEQEVRYAELQSRETQSRHGLGARLGPGEAAVMAIGESGGWTVAIDDGAARRVLGAESPGTRVTTTRELIRKAVSMELRDSNEAGQIYADMLERGYRGPGELWP
jgi:predicted nucleic acid-binding protein